MMSRTNGSAVNIHQIVCNLIIMNGIVNEMENLEREKHTHARTHKIAPHS